MAGQASGIVWDRKAQREFEAALKRGFDSYKIRTREDLERIGLTIQNGARRYCPVDTGRLRSSIRSSGVREDGKGLYVEVGTNVEYATFVEFGTRRQRPQPFLRPAFMAALARWGR